jgi:hypothetical protein
MKKETLQQIFKRTISDNLMNIIFEKKEVQKPTAYTNEEQIILLYNSFNIKVQSVALPEGFVSLDKTEQQFLDWMGNTIHSQHTAYYQMTKKYDGDAEHLGWSNNKTQNQRYLEWYGR